MADIPENVKSAMEIIPVTTMDEVLAKALTRQPTRIEWDESAPVAVAVDDAAEGDPADSMVTH